ncbi:galectin-4-like isoform X2 [Octopus vulgaris]|uniref:Galectin n=1 Tax=Octopus vulgaris TaxID=6645 RepID=A0AA36B9B2_OCTVU|nr:galectin-4-like isoform X2 [Octopus vulgaris]
MHTSKPMLLDKIVSHLPHNILLSRAIHCCLPVPLIHQNIIIASELGKCSFSEPSSEPEETTGEVIELGVAWCDDCKFNEKLIELECAFHMLVKYQVVYNVEPLLLYKAKHHTTIQDCLQWKAFCLFCQKISVVSGKVFDNKGTCPYQLYQNRNLYQHPQYHHLIQFQSAFNILFSINLKFGCETPFHLDVRFHYGASRNTVVCNSYIFGAWGNEEVHSHFPFSCGNSFEIKIIKTPHMYKVLVNGHHYLNFNHRFPAYNQVNKLEIEGDVVLTLVEFK